MVAKVQVAVAVFFHFLWRLFFAVKQKLGQLLWLWLWLGSQQVVSNRCCIHDRWLLCDDAAIDDFLGRWLQELLDSVFVFDKDTFVGSVGERIICPLGYINNQVARGIKNWIRRRNRCGSHRSIRTVMMINDNDKKGKHLRAIVGGALGLSSAWFS